MITIKSRKGRMDVDILYGAMVVTLYLINRINRSRTKLILIIFILTTLSSCTDNKTVDTITLRIGVHKFQIPKVNAVLEKSDVDNLFGKKRTGIVIIFKYTEMKTAIPDLEIPKTVSGKDRDAFISGIYHISKIEEQRILYQGKEKQYLDLWYGEGNYTKRIIMPVIENRLYRIYENNIDNNSWRTITRYPKKEEKTHEVEYFWNGYCSMNNLKYITCRTKYVDKKMILSFDFETTEKNLILLDEIGKYIEAKLISWETDPTNTPQYRN